MHRMWLGRPLSKACPSRDDPMQMYYCNKAKHSVRACPDYKGTYNRYTPNTATTSATTTTTTTSTSNNTQNQHKKPPS